MRVLREVRTGLTLSILAALLLAGRAVAQSGDVSCADSLRSAVADLATSDRDLVRTLQLAGALPVRSGLWQQGSTVRSLRACADSTRLMTWALEPAAAHGSGVFVRLVPVEARLESNSAYRRDRNNGTLRGGVGASTLLTAGGELNWKWLSARIAPEFVHDANGAFRTVGTRWQNPYQPLDFPQRFGDETVSRIAPGQSYVRVGLRHLEAGVSTENFWLGAGQVYPILMSSTAPGFAHAFAGTAEPFDAWIARIGVHAVWGRLAESPYFDTVSTNDRQLFAALLVEAQPRWLPGLTVGIARAYQETVPAEGFGAGDWVKSPFVSGFTFQSGGNQKGGNAIGALLGRWVFPQAGFEAYGEWTREDTPLDLRDLVLEPDWTQAYLFGFSQLATFESYRVRSWGELMHLGEAAPLRSGKGQFSYYTHGLVAQGYTNEGQILGASPGPGSDAQILGADVFHRWGMSGLWLERTRYDDDTYYRVWGRHFGESRHDVEVGLGLRHTQAFGGVRLSAELLLNRRENRSFLNLEDRTLDRLVEHNVGLNLRAVWNPGISWSVR